MNNFYGIEVPFELRPRQLEAVRNIERGNDNLVVLPTGGGKTLVAMIAIAKVLSEGYKAILLSPFKALTYEQTDTLSKYFPKFRIILDDGDNRKELDEYKNKWHILISTYERFNSIINKQKSIFNDVRIVVIDEVHNVGSSRGPNIESAIYKCRMIFPNMRFLGLSATIDNYRQFADDLKADLTHSPKSERPVPLKTKLITYPGSFNSRLDFFARIDILKQIIRIHKNKTFLIFVTARSRTEGVVAALNGKDPFNRYDKNRLTLEQAIYNHQMAWHSSDLAPKIKNDIENRFRNGKIKLISCTPTLSAGVNLPADVCVIFDMYQFTYCEGKELIDKNRLNQTMGRAGRPGMSKIGYAYILCSQAQRNEVVEHIKKPFNIESQLKEYLKAKLLEWVVAGILTKYPDIDKIRNHFIDKTITDELINNSISWLIQNYFIKYFKDEDRFIPTFKGNQTTFQQIKPETVLHWERALYKNQTISNPELFCLIASAPEYANIVVPYDYDQTKISYARSFVNASVQVEKEFIMWINNQPIDLSDHIYKIFALTFDKELMGKYGLNKNEFTMSKGDRYKIKDASERYLRASNIICNSHKDQLKTLKIGSEHSIISGNIIELAKLKGIGDIRLNLLLNNNIDSIQKLISTPNSELSGILGLKENSINQLKISVVELMK